MTLGSAVRANAGEDTGGKPRQEIALLALLFSFLGLAFPRVHSWETFQVYS
jgi:hypothetical protein